MIGKSNTEDALFVKSVAIPAAASTATSEALDLGLGGFQPDGVDVVIVIPAQATLAAGKTVTATLVSSSDNVTFTAVEGYAPIVATGGAEGGSDEVAFRWHLPVVAERYIAVKVDTAADSGAVTGSAVIKLKF